MSNIKEFPKNLSIDSLKSFWEISNPRKPKNLPQRIEHNEQMPAYVDEQSKMGLFIPRKVAESLELELNDENRINLSIYGEPMNQPPIKTGPEKLLWLGTMSEIEEGKEYPEFKSRREPVFADVFVWSGKCYINFFKPVHKN